MDCHARWFDDGATVDEPTDPHLAALHLSARNLIAALERGAEEAVLSERVRDYERRAATAGISRRRTSSVLELLVHEHAAPTARRVSARLRASSVV